MEKSLGAHTFALPLPLWVKTMYAEDVDEVLILNV